MLDVKASLILAFANLVVVLLNADAWAFSREPRDLAATVAWLGSTLYWVVRAVVAAVVA